MVGFPLGSWFQAKDNRFAAPVLRHCLSFIVIRGRVATRPYNGTHHNENPIGD